ncbi:hypothetical protein HDU67_002053, partial [Dinochytrium kinnereticum]
AIGGRTFRIPYKMAFSRAASERFAELERGGFRLVIGCDWNVSQTPLDIHPAALPLIESGFRDEDIPLPPSVRVHNVVESRPSGNVGFRFDGILVSRDSMIHSSDHLYHIRGSDHVPVVAEVSLGLREAFSLATVASVSNRVGVADAMLAEGLDLTSRLGQIFWFLWMGSPHLEATKVLAESVKRSASQYFIKNDHLFRHPRNGSGGLPLRVIGSVQWQKEVVRQAHEGFGGGHRSVFGTGRKIQ